MVDGRGMLIPNKMVQAGNLILIGVLNYLMTYYVNLQINITKRKMDMISAVIVLSTKRAFIGRQLKVP